MRLQIVHPNQTHQPKAAAAAAEIFKALSSDMAETELIDAESAEGSRADLVLAVFSLKHGAFAPIVPYYRDIRDKKVAFVALLDGPVDAARVRKTVWGTKKQFCGNEVVRAYLCSLCPESPSGLSEAEKGKILDCVTALCDEHGQAADRPLAVNF